MYLKRNVQKNIPRQRFTAISDITAALTCTLRFYCCRRWARSNYFVCCWPVYSTAMHRFSLRSSYLCSAAVLWEPHISKKSTFYEVRKTALISSSWQWIFQLIQEVVLSYLTFSIHTITFHSFSINRKGITIVICTVM